MDSMASEADRVSPAEDTVLMEAEDTVLIEGEVVTLTVGRLD
jgi:hypothetical protein